tara:strand:+ start:1486 stop:2007 length:522 start_codon:yes stop_codon:yes gene_type:complete
MPKSKPAGLHQDAYLEAENLFRRTGDLRYLVIAIGKPKSSHFDHPSDIPEWAKMACQEYAETIRQATDQERRRTTSIKIRPLAQNHLLSSYKRAVARLFRPKLSQLLRRRKRVSFQKALRIEGVDDPNDVRKLRVRLKEEERLPPSRPEAPGPHLSRRVEERFLVESSKRRIK